MEEELFEFGDESDIIFKIQDRLEYEGWDINILDTVDWGDPFRCIVDFDRKEIKNGVYKAKAAMHFFEQIYRLRGNLRGKYFFWFDNDWKPMKINVN